MTLLAERRPELEPVPSHAEEPPTRREVLAGPIVAAITLLVAFWATQRADVPLRDPDHVAALYLVLVACGVVVMVGLDIAIRAGGASREAMRRVARERWTLARCVAVGGGILGFYLSYAAYRNLKAIVPLLRPDTLFDRQLANLDRDLFLGHDPAVLLHSLLGTGITAHILSSGYVVFIVFLPLSLALALVFAPNLRGGLFLATALSANWLIGAGSYFLLPSLGPVYYDPGTFASLPHSEVTHLQQVLLDQRVAFLAHPTTATPQAIAAFASLHVSMSLTAALAAHLLGLGRRMKIALWVWLGLTLLDTIYLGWHYVLDDFGGVAIAALALVFARALTGPISRVRA
jgi:hypothetical protein